MEKVKRRLLSTASQATEALGGDPTPLRQAATAVHGDSDGPRPGRKAY